MAGDEFFESPDDLNLVKTKIVFKYFEAWSTLMLGRNAGSTDRIAYVDLFAGKGRFDDGSPSTPLLILERAIEQSRLRDKLVTVFNDKNREYASQLRDEIRKLEGVDQLAYEPKVSSVAVGGELVELLRNTNLIPTLFFIDPWGYKGLSLELIGQAIKNWGCDCIFFFNYNRINPGITNPFVVERMNDLFGAERAEALRQRVYGKTPAERQTIIIETLTEALKEVGGQFVLPFEFEAEHSVRTSHYIIFVSKAFRGYHLMKHVMFSESSDTSDVRTFEYVPVRSTQMTLFPEFGKNHSIPVLKDVLKSAASGSIMTVEEVYERFTVDTPYTLKNVQTALLELEAEGAVTVDPPAASRRKIRGQPTLAKDKRVRFPR